ncbi:MAG: SDR family NAD(P)-dependent oxidoreductase [Magnetococcales bacterium]|nr:SDR family NAD(P)-dependent oxidoreductase [Magnetococcales bacterium]
MKTILITGCSSGIGQCVACGLKKRGYRVFATARNSADVASLRQNGFELYLSRFDLTNSASLPSNPPTLPTAA